MSKDQYEVLDSIGGGTFGSVWKIRRKIDDKVLVWKEINFGSFSEKEKSQLVSEVNIIRELKSPFIVKYYDRIIDKSNTRLYIIMEYCQGGDLGKLIAKCRRDKIYLDESFIFKILAQCILALKDCHRRVDENGTPRPILHRDIKPANILLDGAQNIKAGDFGLAKELSLHTKFAQTNVGTPLYMAPEVINEKGYDEKTDIWSLGCLIYELSALRPPFEATNAVSLAMKINTGKYPRIPTRFSDGLFEVIKLMLQIDPRRRPKVDDLAELPLLQSHLTKAKALVAEYQNHANLVAKTRELALKEQILKTREEDITRREAIVSEKEQKLTVLAETLEVERKRLESIKENHISTQPNSDRVSIGANPMAYKIPIPLKVERNSSILSNISNPSINNVTNNATSNATNVTAAGFQIHCDTIDRSIPQTMPPSIHNAFNSIAAPIPSVQDIMKPSKLSAVAAGQGVKRVQDIIAARPLVKSSQNSAFVTIFNPYDKENIPTSQPPPLPLPPPPPAIPIPTSTTLNVLGRRGLRERQQNMNDQNLNNQNIDDTNKVNITSDSQLDVMDEDLQSPLKKPRVAIRPSHTIQTQDGGNLENLEKRQQKKYVHMMNVENDNNHGVVGFGFNHRRMPPPPPILGNLNRG